MRPAAFPARSARKSARPMTDTPVLRDRVAIITGAGRGIALRFAREGAKLALVDIEQAHLEETVRELQAESPSTEHIELQADVSSSADVQRFFDDTVARFGRLDVLVNNAGIGNPPVPIINMPEEAWDRTLAVNLKSVFLCSKLAALQYIKQGEAAGSSASRRRRGRRATPSSR